MGSLSGNHRGTRATIKVPSLLHTAPAPTEAMPNLTPMGPDTQCPYAVTLIRSGSRFAALGVPRPVTASQPFEAE